MLGFADRAHVANIKQRAEFEQLTVTRNRQTGEFAVEILLAVDQYNCEDGNFGLLMQGNGISAYPVVLRGNNNCAVDPATGAVLLVREGDHNTNEFTETYPAFVGRCAADARLMKLQGNWLEDVFHDANVKMAEMVLGNMMLANGAQFNKFST